jgi:hypothetical protein
MASPISISHLASVNPAQTAAQPPVTSRKSAQTNPQAITDTVHISSAARVTSAVVSAAQAALQEAIETPAQTAKEASTGDLQAKRLLAKETAK